MTMKARLVLMLIGAVVFCGQAQAQLMPGDTYYSETIDSNIDPFDFGVRGYSFFGVGTPPETATEPSPGVIELTWGSFFFPDPNNPGEVLNFAVYGQGEGPDHPDPLPVGTRIQIDATWGVNGDPLGGSGGPGLASLNFQILANTFADASTGLPLTASNNTVLSVSDTGGVLQTDTVILDVLTIAENEDMMPFANQVFQIVPGGIDDGESVLIDEIIITVLPPGSGGDADMDGDVDVADALEFQRQGSIPQAWFDDFGTGELPLSATTSVPEPAAIALLAAGLLPMCCRRKW